jgi:hypothetical protein
LYKSTAWPIVESSRWIELGGPEAKNLLDRLAKEHREIQELMTSFGVVKQKAPREKT